ncbi:MAG: CPBP family glutamic-type intramembrane protease [Patescibacteria group bacterium]
MFVIIVEILLSAISLYLIGKNVFHYFHFTKKAFLLTMLFSVLYFAVIYLLKDTYLGHEAFGRFIQGSIARPSMLTLALYPIIIAFSEELFFRLCLSEKTNMCLAALVFTAMHWRPGGFPFLMFPILFVFALAQWFLLKESKSLWPLVISHLVATYALLMIYA